MIHQVLRPWQLWSKAAFMSFLLPSLSFPFLFSSLPLPPSRVFLWVTYESLWQKCHKCVYMRLIIGLWTTHTVYTCWEGYFWAGRKAVPRTNSVKPSVIAKSGTQPMTNQSGRFLTKSEILKNRNWVLFILASTVLDNACWINGYSLVSIYNRV